MAELTSKNTSHHQTFAGRSDVKTRRAVRRIAFTGVFSAIAFVLQYIEIPVPFMPTFIKFDFSDFPALIAAFTMGPVSGIVVELIKNLFHCLVSQSFGVGELSNFILGAVFAGVSGCIYKYHKTRTGAIAGALVGAIAMAVVSYPSNVLVVYPVYYQFMPKETILAAYQAIIPSMKSVEQSILCFNVPFTFIKGMIDVVITLLVYRKLAPMIRETAG